MGIEQMGRQLDGDDGFSPLRETLTVVSSQFGGNSSLVLMTLFSTRCTCSLTILVEYLIISALKPLVSAAVPFLGWLKALSNS